MTVPWTVKLALKTNPFFFPAIWVVSSISYFIVVFSLSKGETLGWETQTQAWGAALLYCLMPGYLWCCSFYQWSFTNKTTVSLSRLVKKPAHWANRIQNPTNWYLLCWMATGWFYGLYQNSIVIEDINEGQDQWLDFSMIIATAIMFAAMFTMIGRRVYVHAGLCQAGFAVDVDLYSLHKLRPFADIALRDVLVVMGAVALMPLQSIDAVFRWGNYDTGLLIGITTATVFFLLPMWGVHRSIQKQKVLRLLEIQAELDAAYDRNNIAVLEAMLAHRDRIASMKTWPLDLRLAFRAGFYLVIPPLAWIGAALVEKMVESFLGS